MTKTRKTPLQPIVKPKARQRRERQVEHMRHNALSRHIRQLISTHSSTQLTIEEIARELIQLPVSPDECVSDENARRLINNMLRGIKPRRKSTARLARWLTDEYLKCSETGPITTVAGFVRHILPTLQAPCPFISFQTVYCRINQYI